MDKRGGVKSGQKHDTKEGFRDVETERWRNLIINWNKHRIKREGDGIANWEVEPLTFAIKSLADSLTFGRAGNFKSTIWILRPTRKRHLASLHCLYY